MTSAHVHHEFLRAEAATLRAQHTPENDRAEADAPMLHPDHPLGAEILRLFTQIKNLQHTDGTWPIDVVELVEQFFITVGLDVALPADEAVRRLRAAPLRYTVVGLRGRDDNDFLVAAVLPGDLSTVDSANRTGDLQRHAIPVVATDPDDAETRAGQKAEAG
jgi:hypothetical protein